MHCVYIRLLLLLYMSKKIDPYIQYEFAWTCEYLVYLIMKGVVHLFVDE